MNENESVFKLRDSEGNAQEVAFNIKEYQVAADNGLSLTQYLTQQHGNKTDEGKYGTVIGQFMASAGMYLGEDVATGIKPPTMKAVAQDGIQVGAITRNDGSGNNTASGRLLFPEIIMRTIESELRNSHDDFLSGWESMIAQTATISGPKFEQPIINVTAPESNSSNPISQLAEPDAMVSITVSEVSKTITTKSIGLMISDQAQSTSTLDLVSLAMTAQARGERVRMVEEHISGIVAGDVDRGEVALATFQADTLDSSIVAAGVITHEAWLKYLRLNYRKRNINRTIMTLDTALAVEARTGKPRRDTVFVPGGEFPIDMTVDNLSIQAPRVLIVEDGVIPANTIVGLDSRFAIRKVVNISANYSAIENFLLRRATGFRVDYGELSHKLYTDAFDVMTLTV